MTTFKSWQDYWLFERAVRNENRYFRNEKIESFLNSVLESCKQRIKLIPKNEFLWRAQLGNELRPDYQGGEHMGDIPVPFKAERMVPLSNGAKEGRVNPKGIPYLYLATDEKTAMAEVRPWVSSSISVGRFKTLKILRLIDCSITHGNSPLSSMYFEEPSQKEKEQAIWSHIDIAFSKPITNNDLDAEYIPTQILAEFFKTKDYDGIFYKSLLEDGHNITLFDLDSAKLKNRSLHEVSKIDFKFNETTN